MWFVSFIGARGFIYLLRKYRVLELIKLGGKEKLSVKVVESGSKTNGIKKGKNQDYSYWVVVILPKFLSI